MFLAGGPASGKSTAQLAINPSAKDNTAVLVDKPMGGYKKSREAISEALARNFNVTLVFVYRPFDLAVKGAIGRMLSEGRPVDIPYMAKAHYNAQETFLRLADEFGPVIKTQLAVNDSPTPRPPSLQGVDWLRENSYLAKNYETTRTSETRGSEGDSAGSSERAGEAAEISVEGQLRGRDSEGMEQVARGGQASAENALDGRAARIAELERIGLEIVNAALAEKRITRAQWRAMVHGSAIQTGE